MVIIHNPIRTISYKYFYDYRKDFKMENKNNYYGWENYETWLLEVMLMNEYNDYVYWTGYAKEHSFIEFCDHLESSVKGYVNMLYEEDDLNGFLYDLLMNSLNKINYNEVARSFYEDENQDDNPDF